MWRTLNACHFASEHWLPQSDMSRRRTAHICLSAEWAPMPDPASIQRAHVVYWHCISFCILSGKLLLLLICISPRVHSTWCVIILWAGSALDVPTQKWDSEKGWRRECQRMALMKCCLSVAENRNATHFFNLSVYFIELVRGSWWFGIILLRFGALKARAPQRRW